MKLFYILILGLIIGCLVLAYPVSANAFSDWSAYGDAWKATNDTYTMLKWNSTGGHKYIVSGNASSVYYFVVGGGGAGALGQTGQTRGAGGGAGEVLEDATTGLSGLSGSVSVAVGEGGAAPSSATIHPAHANNGSVSIFSSITARGGEGGSGSTSAGTRTGGESGNLNQGGTTDGSQGTGGGGQTGNGANGAGVGGNGGIGYNSTFTGTSKPYAYGGGGSSDGTPGNGSTDGGGKGSKTSGYVAGTAGYNETGTGGGGEYGSVAASGYAGGSGVVIIKFLTPSPVTTPVSSFDSVNISIATNTTSRGWEGTAPFIIQFTNTSSYPPHTSWVWNYTEILTPNAPVTFNQTAYYNPIYTFTSAGNYSIKLNVTGTYGTNISTQITWINVSAPTVTIPIVQFTTDKTTVMFPGRITINDTSLNSPTMWNYSMGDGRWQNGSANLTYQYTKRGVWTLNLTASNAAGSNTSAPHSKTIRVIGYASTPAPSIPVIIATLALVFIGYRKLRK